MTTFSERVKVQGRSLWSRNADKGVSLRGERLRREGKNEWRQWNPRTSKLASGLLKAEKSGLLPNSGTTCLYLGAGHGTTISHLHDHLCGPENKFNGQIIAVDLSTKCIRSLVLLSKSRPGILPILSDCRDLISISPFLPKKVPWIFQDVSQKGQVHIFIKTCKKYLEDGGTGLLSLKSASERNTKQAFEEARKALVNEGFTIVEQIDLTGWEDKHVLFHVVL
ncbi:MAG: fibrillarin-like rRNA/tRNA 2'-O-methyltransferase [Candidatus Thermoplasmatota archaeon]|nr:fibrillarin-like rRNA/tRNA 2'-O-methyltransferase [Candidatus Thermoplasmatota archaeon]